MAKKVKKGKTSRKTIQAQGPLEWIYLTSAECASMREIYELLSQETSYEVEYWEEAGVMEISLTEAHIDMEESEEEDVYWVTVSARGYEEAMEAMKQIEELCGGSFEEDR